MREDWGEVHNKVDSNEWGHLYVQISNQVEYIVREHIVSQVWGPIWRQISGPTGGQLYRELEDE